MTRDFLKSDKPEEEMNQNDKYEYARKIKKLIDDFEEELCKNYPERPLFVNCEDPFNDMLGVPLTQIISTLDDRKLFKFEGKLDEKINELGKSQSYDDLCRIKNSLRVYLNKKAPESDPEKKAFRCWYFKFIALIDRYDKPRWGYNKRLKALLDIVQNQDKSLEDRFVSKYFECLKEEIITKNQIEKDFLDNQFRIGELQADYIRKANGLRHFFDKIPTYGFEKDDEKQKYEKPIEECKDFELKRPSDILYEISKNTLMATDPQQVFNAIKQIHNNKRKM